MSILASVRVTSLAHARPSRARSASNPASARARASRRFSNCVWRHRRGPGKQLHARARPPRHDHHGLAQTPGYLQVQQRKRQPSHQTREREKSANTARRVSSQPGRLLAGERTVDETIHAIHPMPTAEPSTLPSKPTLFLRLPSRSGDHPMRRDQDPLARACVQAKLCEAFAQPRRRREAGACRNACCTRLENLAGKSLISGEWWAEGIRDLRSICDKRGDRAVLT